MRQLFNSCTSMTTTLGLLAAMCLTAAAETTAVPPVREVKSDKTTAGAKTGPDSESARALMAELKNKLGQDPEKLAELARDRGRQALAEYQYGPLVAKAQASERREEEKRVELRTRSERAIEEREMLRKRLQDEIDQIRRQFKDDKPECDRQLTLVLSSFAPRLLELKDEAKKCTELAETTTKKLADLRRECLALDQRRRLALTQTTKSSRQLRVYEELLKEKAKEAKPGTTTNVIGTTPQRSPEELLRQIDQ